MVGFADYAGMTASTLCLLHCLSTPFLISLFPLLGLAQQDDVVHRYMVVLVTLPVLLALIPGFIANRRWLVLVSGGFGLACFVTAVLFIGPYYGETAETVFAVIGGLHLFGAHLKNRSFCTSCTVLRDQKICSAHQCNSIAKCGENGK
jgi:uncharacterized membrane protein